MIGIARLAYRTLLVALCLAFVALGVVGVRTSVKRPAPAAPALGPAGAPVTPPPQPPRVALGAVGDCGSPAAFAAAANDNGATLATLGVSPFGVAETGWEVYVPLIAREIGAACAPQTAAFASRLALWQSTHALSGAGRMDAATLSAMGRLWLLRRPFVVASQTACPPSPNAATLAPAAAPEAYGGKRILARPAALDAYRRMAAAAGRDLAPPGAQLKIASAFRGPLEEALRCAFGAGCGTPGKARCSAHRTGLAFDFYLAGAGSPSGAFSTASANRLALSRTPTYRWLVDNADRFGFVNYPYEPWHWEWTGEAP